LLTKEELETPRTACEILDWVTNAIESFHETKELRAAAREGKFFAKELIEEALPIALFSSRYYGASGEVLITHVLGSQQYDATVEDRRAQPSPIQFIETTVSDWSYEESLRVELLNRNGSVPAYGEVHAKGPKGNRSKLRAESGTLKHADVREQHIAGVISAVKRKADKPYPDGTALVVRVDDALPFRDDDDVAILDDVARSELVPMLSGPRFRILALEGSARVHLAYEID